MYIPVPRRVAIISGVSRCVYESSLYVTISLRLISKSTTRVSHSMRAHSIHKRISPPLREVRLWIEEICLSRDVNPQDVVVLTGNRAQVSGYFV